MKRRKLYVISYAAVLLGFTLYVILETFVLSSEQRSEESNDSFKFTVPATTLSAAAKETKLEKEGTDTGKSYEDDNISIDILTYRENDTTIYVADIRLSSPEYLKTALAKATYGKNVKAKTSDTAEEKNAILAINGDYYGARETGYVIRNGVLYRSEGRSGNQDLVIWADGSLEVIDEGDNSAQELLDNGAYQVFSFGPGLLTDGEITVDENDEVGQAMNSNPRTAIGIISDCHYVFVVSDGRTSKSEGLTLYELAEFMKELGVTCAYNLDGGGSSTLYFDGEVINTPVSNGRSSKERSVSDIVYIGY